MDQARALSKWGLTRATTTASVAVAIALTAFFVGNRLPNEVDARRHLETFAQVEVESSPDACVTLSGSSKRLGYEQLKSLRSFSKLSKLHIYEVPLADDAGRAIGELHGLTDLELVHNDISDRFLDGIGSLSALAHLTVSHNSRVTDRGMVLCARCPSLREVTCIESSCDDLELGWLGDGGEIRSLTLDIAVDDTSMLRFAQLRKLERLILPEANATSDGVALLRNHASLRELLVFGSGLTDKSAVDISTIPNLQTLTFCGRGIGDRFCEHLSGLPNLRNLSLASTNVTGKGAQQLGRFEALQELNLSGTRLDRGSLAFLVRCVNINSLIIGYTGVGNDDIISVSRLRGLQHLELRNCRLVDDGGIEHLRQHKSLEYLDVGGTAVTASGILSLKGCASLRRIGVLGSDLSESDMKLLKNEMPAVLFQ